MKKDRCSDLFIVPTGFWNTALPSLERAINHLLDRLYVDIPLPIQPVTKKHVSKAARNAKIMEYYLEGKALDEIAAMFDISAQRVHQIVNKRQ